MTDQQRSSLGRGMLGAALTALGLLAGAAGGMLRAGTAIGARDARLSAVEAEVRELRKANDERVRWEAAHAADSEMKWKQILRRWDEAREGRRR